MSSLKQTVRELEARLGAVETEQADGSWRGAVQKRKADRWNQTLGWVLEGTESVEALYITHIENKEPPAWNELKDELSAKFMEELTLRLGVTWPLPHLKYANKHEQDKIVALAESFVCLALRGTVANANPQLTGGKGGKGGKGDKGRGKGKDRKGGKGGKGTRERKKFHFKLILRPGLEAFEFHSAAKRVLENALRVASG